MLLTKKCSIGFLAFCSFLFLSCSSSLIEKSNGNFNLTHAKADWIISFPIQDFTLATEKHSDNEKTSYYLFEDKKSGLVVSFFVEPIARFNNAKSYRDYSWEKLKPLYPNASNVKKFELKEAAAIEYFIPSLFGREVNQLNMNIHYVKGENWIDIHISKENYKESEIALFTDFYNSFSFIKKNVDNASATTRDDNNDALDYFAKGSDSYFKQDFKSAVGYYEKALDKETILPTLEKKYWYVLIDNLGMSYALTNDLKKSKDIFEYGISKEPAYPLFYYNLACVFAESANLDGCLSNLELAIKHKENMIEGEEFPDPMKDSSFQRFIDNPQFLKVVHQLHND